MTRSSISDKIKILQLLQSSRYYWKLYLFYLLWIALRVLQGTGSPAAMVTENSSPPLQKQLLVWHTISTAVLSSQKSAFIYLLRYVWDMHLLCSQARATDVSKLLHTKKFQYYKQHKTCALPQNHHSYCVLFQTTISQLQIDKLRYKTLHKSTEWGRKILTITYEPLWEILQQIQNIQTLIQCSHLFRYNCINWSTTLLWSLFFLFKVAMTATIQIYKNIY